jgi:hypothetical protein
LKQSDRRLDEDRMRYTLKGNQLELLRDGGVRNVFTRQ